MIENDNKDNKGIVIKPNRSIYFSEHETPWLQG